MSCVAPDEIVNIVARVFGVTPEAMRHRSVRCVSWPYTARGAAVFLIRRHTLANVTELCGALGLSHIGQMRTSTVRLGNVIEQQAKLYGTLGGLIAKCEDAIDELHEKRINEHVQWGIEDAIARRDSNLAAGVKERFSAPRPTVETKRRF